MMSASGGESSVRYVSLKDRKRSAAAVAPSADEAPPSYSSVVSNNELPATPAFEIIEMVRPAAPGASSGVHIVQQVYQSPPEHHPWASKVWYLRFLLALVAGLLALGLFLVIWHLLDASNNPQPSLQFQGSSEESDNDVQPTILTTLSGVDSVINTGSTKEQQCLKRCYDNVFLACACNQQCLCPPKRVIDISTPKPSPPAQHGHFGPFDFLDKLFNDDDDNDSKNGNSNSGNVVSSACVALCGPMFIPHPVACDELLFSCE